MGITESTIKELIKPCECLSHIRLKCKSPCCKYCCDDGCECLVDTTTPKDDSDDEGNISSSP